MVMDSKRKKKLGYRWIFTFLALGTSAVFVLGKSQLTTTEGKFSNELECLESLSQYGRVDGAMIAPSIGVVVGKRAFNAGHKDEGLIAFSHDQAYFLLLPKPLSPNKVSHYYMELKIPRHQAIFLNYTNEPNDKKPPTTLILASDTASPEIKNHYVLLKADIIAGRSAIRQIQRELANGVRQIRKNHDLKLAMHQIYPNHFDRPIKSNYEEALQTCKKVKNLDVQTAIKAEKLSLTKAPDHPSLLGTIQSKLGFN